MKKITLFLALSMLLCLGSFASEFSVGANDVSIDGNETKPMFLFSDKFKFSNKFSSQTQEETENNNERIKIDVDEFEKNKALEFSTKPSFQVF